MKNSISSEAIKNISKAVGSLLGAPAREMSELIADQVRYFRWKSLVRITERAREIRATKGISEQSIPLKILLPILEEGSKEDESSDMCERWANLLASAGDEYNSFDLVCIDYLKKISIVEAQMIDSLGIHWPKDKYAPYASHGNRIIISELENYVFSKAPELRVAIREFANKESEIYKGDRMRYICLLKECLEGSLHHCWEHFTYYENDKNKVTIDSCFSVSHPETIFALTTIGIIDKKDRRHNFNTDFSYRTDSKYADAKEKNGLWHRNEHGYRVHEIRLTELGYQFWIKVSGIQNVATQVVG